MAAKYLPAHDDVFPRIAALLPAARFIFVENQTAILKRRLEAAFARRGLAAANYCHFVPGCLPAGFSALARDTEVFLDTLGWSGFNTTLDARGHGTEW